MIFPRISALEYWLGRLASRVFKNIVADFSRIFLRCENPKNSSSHSFNSFEAAELHVFCDASESAYAGVAYLVSKTSECFHSQTLCSKRLVGLMKTISVPRLELCTTLQGSTLCGVILATLNLILKFDSVSAWSDSTAALSRIKSTPKRSSNYVANRVSKIQEEILSENWNHIPPEETPPPYSHERPDRICFRKHFLWLKRPTFLTDRIFLAQKHVLFRNGPRTAQNLHLLFFETSCI